MDFLTRDGLRGLVSHSGGPCVSIYLPAHHSGSDTIEDSTRFDHLLHDADDRLRATGMPRNDVVSLLRPAQEMLNDSDFWHQQRNGLTVFLAADLFRAYRVQLKVPGLTVVAERFHVKPLVAAIANNRHFYVLALHQNRSRLFRGTQESLVELEVTGMPSSRSETPQEDPVGSGRGGHLTTLFQDAGEANRKEAWLDYFRLIDQTVNTQLIDDPGPLILACGDSQQALYRKVNSNRALLDAWISSPPDTALPNDLHQQAIAISSAHFSKAQKQASDQYLALWHTQRASNNLSDILPAALHGRVSSLLMAAGVQIWGRLDATTNEAIIFGAPKEGAEDLLNMAALHTYIGGGTVHAVAPDQVPGGGDVAAVFRY